MKLEIYRENKTEKELTRIILIRDGKDIDVVCVDANGKPLKDGHILGFRPGGGVYLYADIDADLGFDTDGEGRIKTVPERLLE